jgi:competence ComEA-like helix-hairpin-helix protein
MAKKLSLNINEADLEALQQLPGIGESLAERIIEGRPYQDVEDLRDIRGLGQSKFEGIKRSVEVSEKIRSELVISPPDEPASLDPLIDLVPSEVRTSEDGRDRERLNEKIEHPDKLSLGAQPVSEKPKPPRRKSPRIRKTLSRAESLWLVFGVGFIAIILSVITTLVIVAGINNTLDFNRLRSIQNIESNLTDLEKEINDLSSELDSINRRVAPLEGLSGRLVGVEEQLGSIQGDVRQAVIAVDSIQANLDLFWTETSRLSDQVVRFDYFLDGLEELMRMSTNTETLE